MQQQEETQPNNNNNKIINHLFIKNKKIEYGNAIYLIGNIPQLGSWNKQKSLRMQCYQQKHWILNVDVPINKEIQYTFYIGKYNRDQQVHNNNNGIGEYIHAKVKSIVNGVQFNKVFIDEKGQQRRQKIVLYEKLNDNEALKIMSFNIRYQNNHDKGKFHWKNRKQNCVKFIKKHKPTVLGVQQATKGQKEYLVNQLASEYEYFGTARDLGKGEQVGVFVDKSRMMVLEHGFEWISESRTPGSIGYGAKLPRYFTYLILEDTFTSVAFKKFISSNKKQQRQTSNQFKPFRQLIMVINVHLDHQSFQSKKKGIQIILEKINLMKEKYNKQSLKALKDIFILGDFNTTQKNIIFQPLVNNKMISIRQNLFKNGKQCNTSYTFNGFCQRDNKSNNYNKQSIDKANKQNNNNVFMTIDHIFLSNQQDKRFIAQKFQVFTTQFEWRKQKTQNTILSDHYPILGTFKHVSN